MEPRQRRFHQLDDARADSTTIQLDIAYAWAALGEADSAFAALERRRNE